MTDASNYKLEIRVSQNLETLGGGWKCARVIFGNAG